jgi:diketogulonate reductase-like aldo/keto reductase
MNKIKLNNNIEIPQIGVGTWTLRGETARRNVRLALEAGFRHIDTAQGYENETEVGHGIADSGVARQEIFVTTKVNTSIMRQGKQAVIDSIDENLGIMAFSLSDEDMQAISGLNQNLRSNVLNDPETFPW